MKNFLKSMDDLPYLIKIIFALPGIDSFTWGIYRIIKGIDENDMFKIVIGIIWLLSGWAILWIIDLVTIILNKKPTVFV